MEIKHFALAGISAGLVIFIVSMVVGMVVQSVFPYNLLELGGMRAGNDPLMILFFLHPWVLAFAMVFVYEKLGRGIQGSPMSRGKTFGLMMWIVVSIPSEFLVYSSMDYPIGFTLQSFFGSLIYMVLSSMVIARIMR